MPFGLVESGGSQKAEMGEGFMFSSESELRQLPL